MREQLGAFHDSWSWPCKVGVRVDGINSVILHGRQAGPTRICKSFVDCSTTCFRLNPQGMITITSGCQRNTASHGMRTESAPRRPRSSTPPAILTISGTQCPLTYTGSSHSMQKTRGRRSNLVVIADSCCKRFRPWSTSCSASRKRSVAVPNSRTFC